MSTKTRIQVHDSQGVVGLGKVLGKGGEGTVYEVAGQPDRVAKVYHRPASAERAAKIEAMVALKSSRLLSLAAWPLDLLRSAQGQPIGLVMPMVDGHKDIHTLYSPRSRKVEFPSADWRFLIRAAANTARAFAAIHETGCVIGDVNHGGIRISDKATVRLIDCDSFQVSAGGRKYLCEVGVPTFTPPELQGKPFRGVVRTANHDNFGLAVMVFHLLFMGRHPFAGRFLGRGDMSIEQAIGEFRFAYGAARASIQMEPPPNVPPISIASQPVSLLFERAFSHAGTRDGVRPTGKDWIAALEGLEKQLKPCHANLSHHYFNALDHCPWCRLETATGAVLFNVTIRRSPPVGQGDIATLWVRITAVASPPPVSNFPQYTAQPTPEAMAQGRRRVIRPVVGYGGLAAAMCALIVLATESALPLMVAGYIGWMMVRIWVQADSQTIRFQNAFKAAEKDWKAIKARWDEEASDRRFSAHLRRLQEDRDQLHDLPNIRQKRYQQLEKDRAHQQRYRFLERHDIEHAKISGIGPGRKAMLESYNIETAWDVVESDVMRVPGFGPALTNELLKWRQGIEARFRFDPMQGVDPQDIAALDREMAETERKLKQNLVDGPQRLMQIRNHILAQRTVLMPQMIQAGRELAQAEANLKAARG
jgi:DNA-binding helix-hairpin-helix protein with protein kinase domain